MFCKYCGAENPDGSKFCKKCGKQLVEEKAKTEIKMPEINTQEVKEKANKAIGDVTSKVKNLPKKVWMGIGAGLVALIAIIVLLTRPTTINLNNYLVFETSGYDGYGKASIYFDEEKFAADYGEKIKFKDNIQNLKMPSELAEYMDQEEWKDILDELAEEIQYYNESPIEMMNIGLQTYGPRENLSNGDVVEYSWPEDYAMINSLLNCNFKYENGTYTVSGLQEAVKIEFFKDPVDTYVSYEGRNGATDATLKLNYAEGEEIYRDDSIIVVARKTWNDTIEFDLVKDNKSLGKVGATLYNAYGLSNGDTFNLSLTNVDALINLGYLPTRDNIEITVVNRPELLTSGESVTKEMISEYMADKLPESNDYNVYSNLDIHSAVFTKAPDTVVTDYPTQIVIDYSYNHEHHNWRSTTTEEENILLYINNPYVDNGKLYGDSYDTRNLGTVYSDLQANCSSIGIDVEIKDYGDLLNTVSKVEEYVKTNEEIKNDPNCEDILSVYGTLSKCELYTIWD